MYPVFPSASDDFSIEFKLNMNGAQKDIQVTDVKLNLKGEEETVQVTSVIEVTEGPPGCWKKIES
jgi:hypothetical protein